MATPLTAIPDHLLADILLRLPAPEDLARASAACVSFRRLVTAASFLRRFRRLHAPPLLGFLDGDGFSPALPPHPSAPGALSLEHAADFSFAFLPSHCRWTVRDMRDGRVLLDGHPARQAIRDLVVCDPLHRRYILLPPVPDHLIASVPRHPQYCKPFLVPLIQREEEEVVAAFRVICMVHCNINLSALVFSSSTGQWTVAASKAWADLVRGKGESEDVISEMNPFFLRHHYAYGCFYWDWLVLNSNKLLVLDTRKMEFSMAALPPGDWSTRGLAIVEAGDGSLGIFGFHGETASHLRYTIAPSKGDNPSQCLMEKTIPLDCGEERYCITDSTERYLLLGRTQAAYVENPLIEYFSLDIKTLKLQRLCAKQGMNMYGKRIYANFPPSLLSSPTI